MKYIDSGVSEAAQTLGQWLETELTRAVTEEVVELRWQSGYFTADALGILRPALARLAAGNHRVSVLVGSNPPGTVAEDVLELVEVLGLPTSNANLGIVRYGNALFHPKTYHLRRRDGSQCAYVGSANLTPAGVSGRNVEAGIILDTREGDYAEVLNQIATAVDQWFIEPPAGINFVQDASSVEDLVAAGVLAASRPEPPSEPASPGAGNSGGHSQALRRPLIHLPRRPPGIPAGSANRSLAMNKTTLYKELAAKTGLKAKQVASVFEALAELIVSQLGNKGPGEFVIPNLVKLKLVKKPALTAGMYPNPFKPSELMKVEGKPATVNVKAVILKSLGVLSYYAVPTPGTVPRSTEE